MKISFGEELGGRGEDVEKKSIESKQKNPPQNKTCIDTAKEDI